LAEHGTQANSMRFADRQEAGHELAARLQQYNHGELVVLGLPRGGVPVGYAVAEDLEAPLDVYVVRKVGVPGHSELAMGAVAGGGVVVRNEDVLQGLQIPQHIFDEEARQQQLEVRRREALYRGHRPDVDVRGRTAILVDDGLATGASMKAAVQAVGQRGPRQLVVGVPVAARVVADRFRRMLDRFVCLHEPEYLDGVGRWYEDFHQTTDDEVRQLLDAAAERYAAASHGD